MKNLAVGVDLSCSGRRGSMSTAPSSIRIMTVDDHPLLRQGIAALIKTQPDMEMVAEACDGEEAIARFRLHRPDVTLMDLQMPNVNGTLVGESYDGIFGGQQS